MEKNGRRKKSENEWRKTTAAVENEKSVSNNVWYFSVKCGLRCVRIVHRAAQGAVSQLWNENIFEMKKKNSELLFP